MEKIYWEVPHYKQESSRTCGLACARMLLGYFGFDVTEEELRSEKYMHTHGSWYSDMAKPFLQKGLKTTLYSIDLNLFSIFWAGENEEKLKEHLLERKSSFKGEVKIKAERVINYIDLGGKLEVRIPDTNMLLDILKKHPIIVPVCRSLIYKERIDDRGHYFVVNGFDGSYFSVLDPGRLQRLGKEFKVKKEVLQYAWLANNRDSDGYLLEITK